MVKQLSTCQDCGWSNARPSPHPSFCDGDFKESELQVLETSDLLPKGETRTTSSTGGQKGVKLARFDLIPIGPLTALAEHYGRGALKYDNHQWRNGYEWSKSYAALLRHLTAWWNGEEYDVCPFHVHSEPQEAQEQAGCKFTDEFPCVEGHRTCYNHTGGHHLDGVMWHSFTLREFVETYPEHDDRYKSDPDPSNEALISLRKKLTEGEW